jgi:isopenicillin-N epimerase
VDHHEWTGTRDIAAYLSVPEAIKFHADHDWESVRKECHQLAGEAQQMICKLFGLTPLHLDESCFAQFVSIPLPGTINAVALKEELYNQFLVEVPVLTWNGRNLIRVSVQGYNSRRDIQKLVQGLRSLV